MAELLRVEPREKLVFEVAPGVTAKTNMILTNIHTENLAFKIKTTSADSYIVHPSKGILEPGEARSISLSLKPQPASVRELNHKFNVVYAPTSLMTSQEAKLQGFWNGAKDVSKAIVLRTQIVKTPILSAMSTLSEASFDVRSEASELQRDYKKLMTFSQQQAQEKTELTGQLSMLKQECKKREEEAMRRRDPGQPLYGQIHFVLVVLLGVVVGSIVFRAA